MYVLNVLNLIIKKKALDINLKTFLIFITSQSADLSFLDKIGYHSQ